MGIEHSGSFTQLPLPSIVTGDSNKKGVMPPSGMPSSVPSAESVADTLKAGKSGVQSETSAETQSVQDFGNVVDIKAMNATRDERMLKEVGKIVHSDQSPQGKLAQKALAEMPPNITGSNLIKMMKPFPTIYAKLEKLESQHKAKDQEVQGQLAKCVNGPADVPKTEEQQTPTPAATPVSNAAAKPTLSPEERAKRLESVTRLPGINNNDTQHGWATNQQARLREMNQKIEDARALQRLADPTPERLEPMKKGEKDKMVKELNKLLIKRENFILKARGLERGNRSPGDFTPAKPNENVVSPEEKFKTDEPKLFKKMNELNKILINDDIVRNIPPRPSL